MNTDISKCSSTDMRVIASGLPRTNSARLTVGDLVARLNARYPYADAEPWDKMGLLVGDPLAEVKAVCVALDVTLDAIDETARQGAQVLLTHHPAYLTLDTICADPRSGVPGALVYRAISKGVALVNYHTALDVSPDAHTMLPSMLHAHFEKVLCPRYPHMVYSENRAHEEKGYGQIAVFDTKDVQTLATLAARCVSVFGRAPRVWDSRKGEYISRIATWTGSADETAVARCLEEHVDVFVCGEIKYHTALDAQQKGLSIIELGHDVSENPYGVVLARALKECGMGADSISLIERDAHWYNPETRRV